jgi:plastocyanin
MMLNFWRARGLVLALLLVTCSWGVASAAPPGQAHEVTISGMKYQSDVITVHVGDTVQWKNSDVVPHTATATDGSFSSVKISPGGTWKFVAKKLGTFPYICTPHPNMHGTLIVE